MDDSSATPSTTRRKRTYYLWVIAIIGLGAAVLWPSRHAGMITDDYMEIAMLDGVFAAKRHPLDLFTFTTGTPEDLSALQRLGSMPYWVHPELKLSFLRPLSSALVIVDRTLLGWNLPLCHLHSIAWWAALCMAVALFYRRLLPDSTALWATALFSLSDAHHFAVTWLANRGGIVSLLFGLLGLQALVLGRNSTRAQLSALLLFMVSLLGGEWVFPLFGFALTYLFYVVRARDLGTYLRRLWPMVLPAVVFIAARAALDYGARGSGVYVDPAREPLRFLSVLATRAPILSGDLLLGVPAHWWDTGSPWRYEILRRGLVEAAVWQRLPSWRAVQVGLGLGAAAAFSYAMRLLLKRRSGPTVPVMHALLAAALLALVPVSASFPSSRLGLPALIFAAPGMALLIQHCLRVTVFPAGKRYRTWFFNGALLALLLQVRLLGPTQTNIAAQAEYFRGVEEWVLSAEVDDALLPKQNVIILGGGAFTPTFFFPYVLHAAGRPMPKSSYPLLGGHQPVDLYRDTKRSFLVRPVSGTLLSTDAEIFFRSPDLVPRPGQHFTLPEMQVEVTKVWKRKPLELRVTFQEDVDAPRYLFLHSTPLGMARFKMPKVGQWTRINYPAIPNYFGARRGHYERRIGPLPDFIMDNPMPEILRFSPRCTEDEEEVPWKVICPRDR